MFLILIVHIICLKNKSLLLLKEVINLYLGDEVWIQIVINALSSSNLSLQSFVALFFKCVKHNERICFRESVQIWQVSKRECQTQLLFELCCIGVADVTFNSLKCGIIDILPRLMNRLTTDGTCIVFGLWRARLKYATHLIFSIFIIW